MTKALQERPPKNTAMVAGEGWTKEQKDLIKATVAKGTSDDEFSLFLYTCRKTGLDPLIKQIHAVKRWDSQLQREAMAIQVGIDGYRLTAQRTLEMDGQDGPFWCTEDGEWKDVWTSTKPPAAAKVVVYRKGHSHPYVGIARYEAYVQKKKDGTPNSFWSRMPDGQLAKCAEALALRKAFPNELGGTHTEDELAHAAGDAAPAFTEPRETEIVPSLPPAAPPPAAPKGGKVERRVKVISAKGFKDGTTLKVTYKVTLEDSDGIYVAETDSADLARQAKALEGNPKEVVAVTIEDPEHESITLSSIRPA